MYESIICLNTRAHRHIQVFLQVLSNIDVPFHVYVYVPMDFPWISHQYPQLPMDLPAISQASVSHPGAESTRGSRDMPQLLEGQAMLDVGTWWV